MTCLTKNYEIAINTTPSLPETIFIVAKGVQHLKRGDYIVFKKDGVEGFGKPFVKIVAAISGDRIRVERNEFYVNGQKLAKAKSLTLQGERTRLSKAGVIPKEHYFVYAPHKDSLDSRYEKIGWIKSSDVIGRAYPLL